MDTDQLRDIKPSIVCDELGCDLLAAWSVESVDMVAYSCAAHLHEAMDPDESNVVKAL